MPCPCTQANFRDLVGKKLGKCQQCMHSAASMSVFSFFLWLVFSLVDASSWLVTGAAVSAAAFGVLLAAHGVAYAARRKFPSRFEATPT